MIRIVFELSVHFREVAPHGSEIWCEDAEGVVTFCSQEEDGDFLFARAGEVSSEIGDLSGGFLGDGVGEIGVWDEIVGDQESVGEAENEKSDGW